MGKGEVFLGSRIRAEKEGEKGKEVAGRREKGKGKERAREGRREVDCTFCGII